MKELNLEQATHVSNAFKYYFEHYDDIESYMREEKLKHIDYLSNPLFPIEDDLFSDFTMHPKDMDIELCQLPPSQWEDLMNITSSHINKSPVGRNIQLAARERNTGKVLGFIRLGSPMIYMRPRNQLLGHVFSQQVEWSKRFNQATIMGFVIVPAQPFGFNYLGGKLLALMCTSHEVREIVNKKYNMNLCLFETTSLYGSTKGVSQYDGLKPYIHYRGNTESDIIPMMHGDKYNELKKYVEDIVGDLLEGDSSTTSRKLRSFTKMIAITKSALKGTPELLNFNKTIEDAKSLTEQKRYYTSNYGFSNYLDYLACKTDTLIPGENYEKHNLSNIVEWWRNKATNRYETLKADGRLRTELEVWNKNKDIQIIR
jgi:hypothetical protein